ncbi:MAG: tetratricopeptide repeat protein, partial [Myxococcota bacterium]
AWGLWAPALAEAGCKGEACVAPCDDGDADACGELARHRWKEGERSSAYRLYIRACDGNHLDACVELGAIYAMTVPGVPADKDLARAREFYAKACKGGYHKGCLGWGEVLSEGPDANAKKASKAWQRACDKGAPSNYYTLRACFKLGELTERGDGVKADPEAAAALYRRGCKEVINPESCAAAERLGG